MENKNKLMNKLIFLGLILSGIVAMQSCKKTPYGEDFDISYPTPAITSVISSGNVESGITILGTNLDQVLSVKLGGAIIGASPLSPQDNTPTFLTQTQNEITTVLPRKFAAGTITLENYYRRTATAPTVIAPIYPNVTILGWPTEIYSDSSFIILGKNMDMVSQIDVNGSKIDVSTKSMDTIRVNTGSITAPIGTDSVYVTISKALSIVIGPVSSPKLPIKKP